MEGLLEKGLVEKGKRGRRLRGKPLTKPLVAWTTQFRIAYSSEIAVAPVGPVTGFIRLQRPSSKRI